MWATDGSALHYRSGTRILRAPVTHEAQYAAGSPVAVAEGTWMTNQPYTVWDVHPDGDVFLFVTNPGAEVQDGAVLVSLLEVELVVNWFTELRERAGI